MPITKAAVYLGSKHGNNPVFDQSARELGVQLAKTGITVIYGGTNIGTMSALADGVTASNGVLIGVIPASFIANGFKYDNLSQLIVAEDLKDRKAKMEELSEAAIILPGSYGTMDELFEYAVNNQLNKLNRPIIFFNIEHFYDPLLLQLEMMEKNGFLTTELKSMMLDCNSVEQIVNILKQKE